MVNRAGFFKIPAVALAAIIALGLYLGQYNGGWAQAYSGPKLVQNLQPKLAPDSEKNGKTTPEKPLSEQNLSLDDLFAKLKQQTDAKKARLIERAIWHRWGQSGSDTVDLLMDWSAKAMKDKDWPTALDLLDQVIVLAPQYAEGWNRRATVHFLASSYGRSLHDIEQVLKLETRHFGAMAGLSNILQKLNEPKRALVMWKYLLEVYPAHSAAKHRVAELEEKLSGQDI